MVKRVPTKMEWDPDAQTGDNYSVFMKLSDSSLNGPATKNLRCIVMLMAENYISIESRWIPSRVNRLTDFTFT